MSIDWKRNYYKRFQFQYGTIERGSWYAVSMIIPYFNSSMVRLRETQWFSKLRLITNFNSSMVRLRERSFHKVEKVFDISIPVWYDWEPLQSATLHHPIIDFNSSMVRLRECHTTSKTSYNVISIPVWYDWERVVNQPILLIIMISIPVWYDWEYVPKTIVEPYSLFQFQYGTIESLFGGVSDIAGGIFQFQYGTIESLQSATLHHPIIDFNSSMVRLRVTPHFGC